MAFSNTDSYVADDANNNLRGLFRDNTDNSHTGDTDETDLASTTITGGTMGATGSLEVFAAGTITSANGAKTLKLIFGASTLYTSGAQAGTSDWFIWARISNTTTGAQRIFIIASDHTSATAITAVDYTAPSLDTTGNLTLKVTGTLANGSDTITQTMFEGQVQQIT